MTKESTDVFYTLAAQARPPKKSFKMYQALISPVLPAIDQIALLPSLFTKKCLYGDALR
jgi:hypothetical protein